jgi:hypothetical protein
VTADPAPDGTGPDQVRRVDNGLVAISYVPLTDVEVELGRALLSALARARIAAYLDPAPGAARQQRRLFVAAEERADARTIVAAAVLALGGAPGELPERPDDPLAGVDTDAAFAKLVADWHVDTVAAVREAERELRREDADWRERLHRPAVDEPIWLDDDHYIPPPPPPLPRLAAPTIGALLLVALAVVLLAVGGAFGLASDLTLLLGVGSLLLGAGLLIMRLRERPDDDDDDGAVI